jgi:predicted ATPase
VYTEHGKKDISLFDSVEIKGLFGNQNEYISFEENEHIKILYGLNASGKSTVLSIIQAVLSSDSVSLFRLPFDEVIFRSKRETPRTYFEVPMNLETSEDKRTELMDLIEKSSLDLTLIHRGEESDNVGTGYDVEHLEIPGDAFLDEHTLTVRKFRPHSMEIVFGEKSQPTIGGPLLKLHHKLSRSIPSKSEADSNLFESIRELDYDSLPSGEYSNLKKEYLDSFGGTSEFECVVRSLDVHDLSIEHWRELKSELSHLFTFKIHDGQVPERYHWENELIVLRDVYIKTLEDEDNYIDTQYFIEYLLPKPIYHRIANSANKNTYAVSRHYLDAQENPLGTMTNDKLSQKLGTQMNISPIDYFLQTKKGHTYLWNGPLNQSDSFEILPKIAGIQHSHKDHYALNLQTFQIPQIIHLSAARTVGDSLSEYSELYEFSKSMKNKISDALEFLKYQSNQVNRLKLPYQTMNFDEYDIDSGEAFHCFLDCKSDEFKILGHEIDVFKRQIIEKKRSKIIEETATDLELIESSMSMYKDDIREILLGAGDLGFKLLAGFNSDGNEHVVHAHDHDISIRMIWNAIEDLTSVFRLKKLLQNHFGKNITIGDTGEFLFNDENSTSLRVNQLSSGEKQLILMYWKILDGMNRNVMQNIVLIDEPELSLHITWQRDFVENLEELLFNQSVYGDEADGAFNAKVFIATHSPSILANHIDKTYELGLTDGV